MLPGEERLGANREIAAREAEMVANGYKAYTTSAGWSGYDDAKVARLTRSALEQGFNHFKLKVGADVEDDIRRLGNGRLLISTAQGLQFGIARASELDRHSRKLLERFL